MYTGVLYGIIGLLVALSLLLYLLVRILGAQSRALMKEKIRGDLELLDNNPIPAQVEPEKSPDRPQETEHNFIPSALN